MSRELDRMFYWISMLIPFGFAALVWFAPIALPRWTKIASLVGCVAALAADVITLHQGSLSIAHYPFLLAVSTKQILAGIADGIIISIVIAAACEKQRDADSPDDTDAP